MSPIIIGSQADQLLERVAKELVTSRSEKEAAELHIQELRKHNIELQAKLERYELKEQRLKKVQNTDSYAEMISKVSEYQLQQKPFIMTYLNESFSFMDLPGGS